MRLPIITFALASLLMAGSAHARPTPEESLAKALKGRVAGEPVRCINLSRVHGSQIIDGTAILYDVGNTIYVNRPRGGAESLDSWDVLVTKTYSNELCSPEIVQLYDSGSQMLNGFVSLGEFVPYKKVKTASN